MGLFLLASGTQPHPTVILLHGFPGYEQNIDLAQSLRRDGWNVLAMHYRGAWGSQGTFSLHPLHGRRLHHARLRHATRQRNQVPHRHAPSRRHRPQHGRLPHRRRARPASRVQSRCRHHRRQPLPRLLRLLQPQARSRRPRSLGRHLTLCAPARSQSQRLPPGASPPSPPKSLRAPSSTSPPTTASAPPTKLSSPRSNRPARPSPPSTSTPTTPSATTALPSRPPSSSGSTTPPASLTSTEENALRTVAHHHRIPGSQTPASQESPCSKRS